MSFFGSRPKRADHSQTRMISIPHGKLASPEDKKKLLEYTQNTDVNGNFVKVKIKKEKGTSYLKIYETKDNKKVKDYKDISLLPSRIFGYKSQSVILRGINDPFFKNAKPDADLTWGELGRILDVEVRLGQKSDKRQEKERNPHTMKGGDINSPQATPVPPNSDDKQVTDSKLDMKSTAENNRADSKENDDIISRDKLALLTQDEAFNRGHEQALEKYYDGDPFDLIQLSNYYDEMIIKLKSSGKSNTEYFELVKSKKEEIDKILYRND